MPGNFHEALVQTEVMADGVLPALLILFVVGKVLHDVLVDSVEGETLFGAAADRHHNEGVVAVRWFFVFLLVRFGSAGRRRCLGASDVELHVGRLGRG